MTEVELLSSSDLDVMIDFLEKRGGRSSRLFACACCRRVWDLLRLDAAKRIVEVSEEYADGCASVEQLEAANASIDFDNIEAQYEGRAEDQLSARALNAIVAVRWMAEPHFDTPGGASAVAQKTSTDPASDFIPDPERWGPGSRFSVPSSKTEQVEQIKIIRDIVGNPFRPVMFDPAWRTSTIVALAGQMYKSHDFSLMPILGDALQDEACDNDDILAHCRGDGPHVRGCWVVDLILGKE